MRTLNIQHSTLNVGQKCLESSSRIKINRNVQFWAFAFLVSAISASAQSPGLRIDSATYQKVVDENLDLRKEQARLEAEAGELRRKNASLLLDVRDLERKRDQLTSLISQLKTPDETRSEMAKLQSEKLVLIREIERLRQVVGASVPPPTNSIPASAPTTGSALFRKVEKENADLRMELAKVREASLNASVVKEVAVKGEASLKLEVARLTEQCKTVSVDLENTRRREAAFKKALEVQARKALEAEAQRKKAEERSRESEAGRQKAEEARKKAEAKIQKPVFSVQNSEVKALNPEPSQPQLTVPQLFEQGRKLLVAKRVKDAEKVYLMALRQEPKNPQVSYNLGVLYGDYLKNPRKAAKYYRRYIELAPQAPDVGTVRAWLLDLDARAAW